MGQSRWFLRPCDGMVTASSRGCPLLLLDHGHASLDPRNLRRPISDSGNPPASRLNCEDEGQYVNWKGQSRRSAAGVTPATYASERRYRPASAAQLVAAPL